MDYMPFACVLKVFICQLIDKLKQTIKTNRLYQESKVFINLEKSDLGY